MVPQDTIYCAGVHQHIHFLQYANLVPSDSLLTKPSPKVSRPSEGISFVLVATNIYLQITLYILTPGTHGRLCRAILQCDRVAWQNPPCVERNCTAALQSVHTGDFAMRLFHTAKSRDKVTCVFPALISI